MNQEYFEKVERLLDLIAEVSKYLPDDSLPVRFSEDGTVSMHPELLQELHKDENQDLLPFAQENLKDLF